MQHVNYLFENILQTSIPILQIPLSGCPSRYFEFTFKGWQAKVITIEDNEFIESINFAGETLKLFYDNYKEIFAFSEPMLSLHIDGILTVKIGVMKMELYEKIWAKNEKP